LSTGPRRDETGDSALGMGEPICRRDFLNAAALATGGAFFLRPLELLATRDDWTGYGGVGDYRFANGNTKEVMDAAHAVRDRRFETLPRDAVDTGEIFELVVVGGGLTT
jgi:spermidine dehydrogenase